VSDFEKLDYYALLGVSRSASLDEIKRAYRREISKFHPDRFVNGTPEEKAYASERSQRLTEAYRVLSDFAERSAYNRSQPAASAIRVPRPAPTPAQPRDHQAELYEQAQQHLAENRLLQGIGVLRQLQQINPFYRDTAEQLAAAEARLNQPKAPAAPRRPRPLLVAGGVMGGLVLAMLAAWAIGMRGATASRNPTATSGILTQGGAPAASIATSLPTQPPEESRGTEGPTAGAATPDTVAPTIIPASPITATEPPTIEPSPTPFDFPTITPTTAQIAAGETGTLLLEDAFAQGGWASLSGPGWQVGYQGQQYRIGANQGVGTIWSYRTGPAKDVSIGVDMQVAVGEGGLLVRFQDAGNYVSISLNPSRTSFRVEQHDAGNINVIAGGQSEAIQTGADAINRLVVRLRGSSMEILVNGQSLASADAPGAPDSARYGLLVITNDSASEAFFDNLEIRRLDS
jgi:hypothetical protein